MENKPDFKTGSKINFKADSKEDLSKTDLKKLRESLHSYERKVLSVLEKHASLQEISKASGLKEVEAMRGLQWLQNKGIIALSSSERDFVDLDANGKKYLEDGLPERRFLKLVGGKNSLKKIIELAKLSEEEASACIGVLKSKAAINVERDKEIKGKEIVVSITEQGRNLLKKDMLEESFLKKKFPLTIEDMKDEEKFSFEQLRKRKKILKVEKRSIKRATLTDLGKRLLESGIGEADVYDRLTSDMLKSGSWKSVTLRRYDVKVNVPKVFGGKKHHYGRFLDEVREKFLSLGFQEMAGPLVETEFWDMDALFMPQFHSARDIHAAYYVKDPKYGEVDANLMEKVRASHENGKGTISKGWRYKFDTQKTKQLILRTQGTALSARTLASKSLKIPGKYFAIARCFRPDVVDATHSADFNQIEGIVIEEGLNFRHLKGLLKMFAEEFAQTEQIKITPAYFPFTEPSAELHAKHPELGWIELGGSGIFRPELVKPLLGREISVLAWGLGIDRLAMFKLGIKDIRELFSHNLEFLRNARVV